MFFRWSGVWGGDEEGEEGARVGVEELEGGGRDPISISLSGTGGSTKGRLVIRRRAKRKIALVVLGQRLGSDANENGAHIKAKNILEAFDKNHDSPPGPIGSFPPQAHFDQQLEVAKDFESSCKPIVSRVLLSPCAGISRVRRRWDQGFVLGIRLHDSVQQSVMVQAGRVQQRSHWGEYEAIYRRHGLKYAHASDASSASLNLPGKTHVTERSEDSRLEMKETLFKRNASYLAKADDITEMCASKTRNALRTFAPVACQKT